MTPEELMERLREDASEVVGNSRFAGGLLHEHRARAAVTMREAADTIADLQEQLETAEEREVEIESDCRESISQARHQAHRSWQDVEGRVRRAEDEARRSRR